MKYRHLLVFSILLLFLAGSIDLFGDVKNSGSFHSDCIKPIATTVLDINSVRAHLATGGDIWWNIVEGGYVVPKNLGVSALFAGSIWIGALDPLGNLKLSGQLSRNSFRSEFWSGPLNEQGEMDSTLCQNWDHFFRVTAEEVQTHKKRFAQFMDSGVPYDSDEIPYNILSWPALGNPFFEQNAGFSLPENGASLASFHDYNGDGIYDPSDGDYPVIVTSMGDQLQSGELIPAEQVFHIFNDLGEGIGFPKTQMKLQVNATSFAFKTQDEVNDMTFYQYKVYNKSSQDLHEMYFSLYVKPDLGCYVDDYIGVDTTRNMFYVYNEDAQDGASGCECPNDNPTYCDNIPIIGLRMYGTTDDIGLTSFSYIPQLGSRPTEMMEPYHRNEFYNYMRGLWRNGTPMTVGGDGFNLNSSEYTRYAFYSDPSDQSPESWSMCSSNLSYNQRHLVGSTSFSTLQPGAQKEVLFGVVFVPSQKYPCPSIEYLQYASDLGELFLLDQLLEGVFSTQGPDAPDVTAVENDRQVTILLSNSETSNNYLESYQQRVPIFRDVSSGLHLDYLFEGYMIYQLADGSVQESELDNPDKVRLVAQSDLKNEISDIYNWSKLEDPFGLYNVFVPQLMVSGQNQGIRNSIHITEDAFAEGSDRRLVNHKPYYFMAIAYAYNSFQDFDLTTGLGQRTSFISGSGNRRVVTAIPVDKEGNETRVNYGTPLPIIRLDGRGNPEIDLQLEDEMYDRLLSDDFDGTINYRKGSGPVRAKVVNAQKLSKARLQLSMFNEDDSLVVNEETRWRLRNVDSGHEILSDFNLSRFNEQIIDDYGISIEMFQADKVGVNSPGQILNPTNGMINTRFKLINPNDDPWLTGISSNRSVSRQDNRGLFFHPLLYVKTRQGEVDFALDPTQALTRTDQPSFVPMHIPDFRVPVRPGEFLISPNIMHPVGQTLRSSGGADKTNNVDLILTRDKSKWTRCPVIQASSSLYSAAGFFPSDDSNMFDYRDHPSIGLDGRYATVDGTKDGAVLTQISDNPEDPHYIAPKGMGWFPGYAVDVETGQRLNIMFAENASYNNDHAAWYENGEVIGDDMIWNPSGQQFLGHAESGILDFIMGGQHFIYLTRSAYDAGRELHANLTPQQSPLTKLPAFEQITWAGFPILEPGIQMRSYEEGLIPSDMLIQLRVNQPYAATPGGAFNGMPHYLIDIDPDLSSDPMSPDLLMITLYPNPFRSMTNSSLTLSFLPQNCMVMVFDAQGRPILNKRLEGLPGETIAKYNLELPNHRLTPGVYFIHINAFDEGTTTLKLLYF